MSRPANGRGSRTRGPEPDLSQEELELEPVPDSVPIARKFVLGLDFASRSDPDLLALLTAEIVTNAILHARTSLRLVATKVDGGVRVAVSDGSPSAPVVKNYGATAPTGRGLHIVEDLASRWGYHRSEGGKTVWFELDGQELES
ncbi:MAG: ATP-binding protein [Acidimicrobiia bacterium]